MPPKTQAQVGKAPKAGGFWKAGKGGTQELNPYQPHQQTSLGNIGAKAQPAYEALNLMPPPPTQWQSAHQESAQQQQAAQAAKQQAAQQAQQQPAGAMPNPQQQQQAAQNILPQGLQGAQGVQPQAPMQQNYAPNAHVTDWTKIMQHGQKLGKVPGGIRNKVAAMGGGTPWKQYVGNKMFTWHLPNGQTINEPAGPGFNEGALGQEWRQGPPQGFFNNQPQQGILPQGLQQPVEEGPMTQEQAAEKQGWYDWFKKGAGKYGPKAMEAFGVPGWGGNQTAEGSNLIGGQAQTGGGYGAGGVAQTLGAVGNTVQQANNLAHQLGFQGLNEKKYDFDPIAREAEQNYYENDVPALAERFTAQNGQNSSAFARMQQLGAQKLRQGLAAQKSAYNLQREAHDIQREGQDISLRLGQRGYDVDQQKHIATLILQGKDQELRKYGVDKDVEDRMRDYILRALGMANTPQTQFAQHAPQQAGWTGLAGNVINLAGQLGGAAIGKAPKPPVSAA